MEYKNKIAYDFDGVLCHTMPAFHQYWKEKYDWTIFDGNTREFLMPMPEDYDFKHMSDDIAEAIDLYQLYLRPHAFAMEMVREIAKEYNESPIIITARNGQNKEVTDQWLKAYLGIPYVLCMVGGDTGDDKPGVVEELKIQYFVEDRFKTCNNIKSCEAVFMPDRVWNSGRVPQDHVVRVNNLLDVWDYMKKEEENGN